MSTGAARLDARGLQCPLPVLKAKKAMRTLAVGETLTVLATDPAAPEDFRRFCEVTGHRMESLGENGGVYTLVLRRTQ